MENTTLGLVCGCDAPTEKAGENNAWITVFPGELCVLLSQCPRGSPKLGSRWKSAEWNTGLGLSQCVLLGQKYHGLSGSNNKHLFLTALEAGNSKIKEWANSGSGEGLLPVL